MTSKYVLAVFLSAILLVSAIAITTPTAEAKGATAKSDIKRNIIKGKICGDHLCSQGMTQMPQKQMGKPAMTKPAMGEKMMMAPHAAWKTKSGTLTSVQDPGVGHEGHQLAIILPPSENIYKGIVSYSASENIQLVALTGPLADGEDNGQPIWTPDGKTKFALTFVDPGNSMGTWAFSGNALAVHTKNTTPFTVSYSVTAAQ